jgi:hypothetical protein
MHRGAHRHLGSTAALTVVIDGKDDAEDQGRMPSRGWQSAVPLDFAATLQSERATPLFTMSQYSALL